MREGIEAAVEEWARRIPVDQIPAVLTFLSARLLAESSSGGHGKRDGGSAHDVDSLLTARELAERLNLPESWVRNEERAGRIPGVRLGKYVRFKWPDVERTLAEKAR
jgi:excisionase family DNA binding protein